MSVKYSFVVTAFNIENYIERALKSCIGVDLDCEIIFVDNFSSDRTLEVGGRVLERSGRPYKIVRNDSNIGPGGARNKGLELASGEYLMFLDGDDWFAIETFEKLDAVITVHKPDLIVFDYQRYWDNGRLTYNKNRYLLKEGDLSSVVARQSLMDNFSVVWNKCYKRAFIEKHALSFELGLYEDVSWSFSSLILAEAVYVIPDVMVFYRQRSGSITRSRNEAHFDVFREYFKVWSLLERSPVKKDAYGVAIYNYARRQIYGILDSGNRIPLGREGDYLKKAYSLLCQWRADLGLQRQDVRWRVSRFGSYGLYKAYLAVRRARKISSSLRRVKDYLARCIYHFFILFPVNKRRVLFESYWGAKADCNPLAVACALKSKGYDLRWSLSKEARVPSDFPFSRVRKGSLSYYYSLATAGYFITNTNLPDFVVKRKGSIHVQTWHGTPLKVMGLDLRPYRPREMDWSAFAKRCKRWDYLVSSNEHSSSAWRTACPYDYKVLEIGYPRNDIFFRAGDGEVERIRAVLGIPKDKRVALYAPTVRDAKKGGELSLGIDVFDPKKILAALGDEYVLLVRAHYFMRGVSEGVGVIDVSDYPFSNEVALVSDLLITDYSSLMFDYACIGRPIILYAYDYDQYVMDRGVYFDIKTKAPGPVFLNQADLVGFLESKGYLSSDWAMRLEAFRKEFCSWDDGYATERLIREVFQESNAKGADLN